MVSRRKQGDVIERILIAEDSRVQLEQMSAALEERGYAVEVASDGKEALAAARANPPHLVISDVNMPEMDGYSFCRALKADQNLKDVPFMLVTSLSAPTDVIRGLDCGADNFITKPYQEDALLDRVRYLLTNRALRGSSRVRSGVEIELNGKVHFVSAERHQILDLLISTYAEAVRLSEEAAKRGEQLRESYEIVAVLQRSAEGLNKVHTEPEVAAEALARVQDLPFCGASWILLVDEDGLVRRLVASGLDDEHVSALRAASICACQRDLHLGKLVETTQITDCARLRGVAQSPDGAIHASVPLHGQQHVFGVLNVFPRSARPFTAEEMRILSGLGSQVSAALDRAYLNATLERKVAERTQELQREVAVRQATESAAIDTAARLERAQRIGHVGSIELNLVTKQDSWSDELYRLLGLKPGQVSPSFERFREAIHSDDQSKLDAAHARAKKELSVEPMEVRIVRPDGQMRWLYRHSELVADKNGDPLVVAATYQDITERKRIEGELRHSREHLARVQRITRIGSAEVNLRTLEITWSDEMYELLGLDRTTVKPSIDVFMEAIHPDDRATLLDVSLRGRRGELTDAIELRSVAPDGSVRWFLRQTDFVRDADGRPETMLATIFDITRIKSAEDALRQSREHLTLAQRVGGIGSTAVDLRSGEVFWSEEQFRILGVEPDSMPKTFEFIVSLTHPDDRAKLIETNTRSQQGEEVDPIEFRIGRPDGFERWIRAQRQFVRDDGGRLTKLLITNQDVTAARKAEAERRALEAQLIQAQKMEAVGQLTGGIAHDFNNILAVVIGNLDLLKMEVEEGSEADELVNTAITACLKGSDLTKSLLAFSRRQPLQPKRIGVNQLLRDSVKMLSRAIGENVEVHLRLGDGVWDVLIDPSQLESALLNMMVNSRDAMPNGGHIVVETANKVLDEFYASQNAEVTPGEYVVLQVSDTGTGMTPDVIQKVFEPFFTTKEKGKGTGLGLAMVFGFVKQSGGHIKVYSEVGHGTTIRVYLPRVGNSGNAISAGDKEADADIGKPHGEVILVVEDNPAVLRAVSKQLRTAGYNVTEAENAVKAVELLTSGTPIDMIFSDVIMPGGMNGADLAREVSRRWPNVKVLLTSGFPEGLLENGNKLPNGVNLLSKPYRMGELLRKLREILVT